jgi:hypothetical protein
MKFFLFSVRERDAVSRMFIAPVADNCVFLLLNPLSKGFGKLRFLADIYVLLKFIINLYFHRGFISLIKITVLMK